MRFLLLIFMVFVAAGAAAQEAAPVGRYEVQGITIDMPTESPATARDAALMAATRHAYTQLQERLLVEGEVLPELDDTALGRTVQDFELSGEKVSAKRYIGMFTIRFRPSVASVENAPVSDMEASNIGVEDIPVTFVFESLSEWQAAKTALRNVAGIRGIHIVGLRRNYVDLNLRYAGNNTATLNAALAAQGLISSNQDGRLYMRLHP